MDEPKSVVIMPNDDDAQEIRETVQHALEEVGVATYHFDDVTYDGLNDFLRAIQTSDFIVVDITKHNPNIFYELGYAHGLRKPTILLLDAEAHATVPTNLQGFLYVPYERGNLSGLKKYVQYMARSYMPRRSE